ncbi:MAG: ribonuclease T [Hyphomicrobiaceae bacterium]
MRLPTIFLHAVLALCAAAAAADNAHAQRRDYGYERDRPYGNRYGNDAQRNVAGEFDYYALVLSWSPTHCDTDAGRRTDSDMQCNRRDGRRYNFVLHGLWPQYERGYPESCPTRDRPFVPNSVVDGMLDIMPARGLVIHEYRKHGTCSGLDPAGYYDLARKLFQRIRIPERYVNPFDVQMVAPDQLVRELTAANPGLKPEMIAVSCGGPGSRLKEIRICHSKSGQLQACGRNESQRRLCSARQMYVPPVRSTSRGRDEPRSAAPPRRDEPRSRPQEERTRPAERDWLPGPRGI